jgi:RimJ/RimL family protein N-acetyltransferase
MVWLNVIAMSVQSSSAPSPEQGCDDESVPDVLTGPRVRLRPPAVDDAEAMYASYAADPEVTRYLSWRPHPDVATTRTVIEDFFNVGDHCAWLIEWRATGEVVGSCAWTRVAPHARELGYCLARSWWRRGIASEAVSVLLEALDRDPAVFRVSAHCHVDNAGSAAVLRRCGLSLEGRLVRHTVFPNLSDEPQDVLLFGKAVR